MHSMFINNFPELVSLSEVGLPSKLSLLSITFCKKKLMLRKECGLHEHACLTGAEARGGERGQVPPRPPKKYLE